MSYRIRCYTLFDITYTGILNRQPSKNMTKEQIFDWQLKRNSQANLDTLLQVVSLRSQPEEVTVPSLATINFSKDTYFGFLYENEPDQHFWHFDFSIYYEQAFFDGKDDLGFLKGDCSGVPMIKTERSWEKLSDVLDTSDELRNVYFEVLSHA